MDFFVWHVLDLAGSVASNVWSWFYNGCCNKWNTLSFIRCGIEKACFWSWIVAIFNLTLLFVFFEWLFEWATIWTFTTSWYIGQIFFSFYNLFTQWLCRLDWKNFSWDTRSQNNWLVDLSLIDQFYLCHYLRQWLFLNLRWPFSYSNFLWHLNLIEIYVKSQLLNLCK